MTVDKFFYPSESSVTPVENEDPSTCKGLCGKLNKMCALPVHGDFLMFSLLW